jgi:acetolactate synthase-1/2/3 large subunit
MLGSDAILRALELEGVDVAFGIPGGAILPTYDAMARGTTVRHVLARHEQGAGHMAQGYARASGKVGVAIATSGPGATNLVTPIADAWMDSTPLVCITGQVRSSLIGTDAFQEIDATGITMPIVKHSWLVQDVEELPGVLKAAFHVARTGRCGPVLVDVAKDAQEAELDFRYPDEVDLPGWRPPAHVDEQAVREAAGAIAEAERPIVYAGGGVLNGDACAELLALVDAARLPAVVTLMGKGGLPDSHPLNYGPPGMHGSKYANWALNKADLIVAVGSRFDDRVTGKVSAFAPDAKVIHLDIDAAEVGKIRDAEIPVVGPLPAALTRLVAELGGRELRDHEPWLRRLDEWKALYPYRYARADGVLKPQTVVETLRDLTAGREDVVWTTGVGQHQMWAMQYLVCDRPRTFITSGGLGTMGYGVPAAIGAKAARPEATVVCIDGDGCFQMTGQELATAALELLPIVVVIVNNAWLGMVRQWQELFYDERFAETHLTHQVPDYAQLAEAYGCAGFTVEREDELEATLAEALASDRTTVVDARCDPEEKCFPMVPAGAAALDVQEAPLPGEALPAPPAEDLSRALYVQANARMPKGTGSGKPARRRGKGAPRTRGSLPG